MAQNIAGSPTLLQLKTMKGADGKPMKIVQKIAARDYTTFGMCLLQDENGEEVDLIEKDHISKGAENVTKAILQKWLTSDSPTCTYQHLIGCLRESELGALAELIANTVTTMGTVQNQDSFHSCISPTVISSEINRISSSNNNYDFKS